MTRLFSAFCVLLSAAALVFINGLTFVWVAPFTVFPDPSTFQLFLAAPVCLAAYDPVRGQATRRDERSKL